MNSLCGRERVITLKSLPFYNRYLTKRGSTYNASKTKNLALKYNGRGDISVIIKNTSLMLGNEDDIRLENNNAISKFKYLKIGLI